MRKVKGAKFVKRQRIRSGADVPPEAGAKGEAIALMATGIIEGIIRTAPFELAVVALAVVWRDDDGKFKCIPTVGGSDASAVPAAAAAFRSVADALDAGDFDTHEAPPPTNARGGDG